MVAVAFSILHAGCDDPSLTFSGSDLGGPAHAVVGDPHRDHETGRETDPCRVGISATLHYSFAQDDDRDEPMPLLLDAPEAVSPFSLFIRNEGEKAETIQITDGADVAANLDPVFVANERELTIAPKSSKEVPVRARVTTKNRNVKTTSETYEPKIWKRECKVPAVILPQQSLQVVTTALAILHPHGDAPPMTTLAGPRDRCGPDRSKSGSNLPLTIANRSSNDITVTLSFERGDASIFDFGPPDASPEKRMTFPARTKTPVTIHSKPLPAVLPRDMRLQDGLKLGDAAHPSATPITILLSLTGTAVSLNTASLDLGDVAFGSTVTREVIVQGDERPNAVFIGSLTSSAATVRVPQLGFVVAGNQTEKITLTFKATQRGPQIAIVNVVSALPDQLPLCRPLPALTVRANVL
jgi:hypothetical protein